MLKILQKIAIRLKATYRLASSAWSEKEKPTEKDDVKTEVKVKKSLYERSKQVFEETDIYKLELLKDLAKSKDFDNLKPHDFVYLSWAMVRMPRTLKSLVESLSKEYAEESIIIDAEHLYNEVEAIRKKLAHFESQDQMPCKQYIYQIHYLNRFIQCPKLDYHNSLQCPKGTLTNKTKSFPLKIKS
jgi:hypothetical protein